MKGKLVRLVNEVTEEFLHKFKVGDLVDVREVRRKHGAWTGPHKILAYKIDPSAKDAKPAAYVEIDLGEKKKLKRWLIAGDLQVIRKHIPEEMKQRVRTKRVKQATKDYA
jgi:hypothetical protein